MTVHRVWREDEDEFNDGRSYDDDDARDAAKSAADYDHSSRDGWEWSWPVTYLVRNMETLKCYKVEVERESVPEFWAGRGVEVDLPYKEPDDGQGPEEAAG